MASTRRILNLNYVQDAYDTYRQREADGNPDPGDRDELIAFIPDLIAEVDMWRGCDCNREQRSGVDCSACGNHLDPDLPDDGHDPQCGYLADFHKGTEGRQ